MGNAESKRRLDSSIWRSLMRFDGVFNLQFGIAPRETTESVIRRDYQVAIRRIAAAVICNNLGTWRILVIPIGSHSMHPLSSHSECNKLILQNQKVLKAKLRVCDVLMFAIAEYNKIYSQQLQPQIFHCEW